MCGIVGYVGRGNAIKPVLVGLNNLEYRGYDSAGVAFCSDSLFHSVKQVGRVSALESELAGLTMTKPNLAIGHTRWATHGAPTKLNAHPHFNASKTIFVVHNGIIENHEEIRSMLESANYHFISHTDTEVIPHLIDYFYQKFNNMDKAFETAVRELKGAYAIVMTTKYEPTKIYAARLSSPLVIGVGEDSNMVGSDASAVADASKKIIYLDDYELAIVERKKYLIKNFKNKKQVSREPEEIVLEDVAASKGDYAHFMLKEINEAPKTIQNSILGRIKLETNKVKLGGLEVVENQLRTIERIIIIACGTSYYAGLVGEYLLEEIAQIPVEVQLASEFKYRKEPLGSNTAILAISQSGETADTIAALKKVENLGLLRLGIVNAPGSTIARMTDAGIYCHAGPEVSVASTKAFIAQVSVLNLIALWLGKGKSSKYKILLNELAVLPKIAEQVLKMAPEIKVIAEKYAHHSDFMYLGRQYEFPMALEGALKLKEISYIHAEGYAAGEMKHGPLALIDPSFPTFALCASDDMFEKTASNLQEVKARSGHIIAVATKANSKKLAKLANEIIVVPEVSDQLLPIVEAIVVQLFSYYTALARGTDIDKPRNLAKSVTVE
ncbi:glutamine--fructose-6-phosphate transaminase (isomerizing) [Candidatus Saccharibacteria bacterium]|nr:glutamine--fructose-6-phosphate transaminase (isomerizing) [Candidatus Saccharibacteria bacterium]